MTDLDLIMSHEERHIERNLYRSRLIELVRSNPILWDKKSPDFNQRTMKIRKWLEVSEQLGVSTDKLRRTWENLRDQYRRDLKRTLNKNIRSKWRFFDDMDFIRSNVRIKDSSLGDCGNSDTESDYEDKTCDNFVSCLLSSNMNSTQNNLAANTIAVVATPTFLPIQLNTEWKQQQIQMQQLNTSIGEQNQHNKQNLQSFYRHVDQQQNCDSSEEQKFEDYDDDLHVVDNANTSQDVVKIELDSDSNDTKSNQGVTLPRPSTTVQRQEPLAVPQPSGCTTTAAITPTPTPSLRVSEACVTTSGNSIGAKRRYKHSAIDDASTEDEYKHNFRNQRQYEASQDTSELQDEDYHFVMSILPALRQVTRHRKFPLRSQIMALISKELEESND